MANAAGCQETQGLLQVLVEGGLNATERASVESHLASCPACTAEGARLQENAAFLQEALSPFRMPADLTAEFLLALPRKDQKRRGAAHAPSTAPQTFAFEDTRARRRSPWGWIGGFLFLGAAGGLGYLFLGDREEPGRRPVQKPTEVGSREPKGTGAADPRKVEKPLPKPAGGGGADRKPAPVPPSNEPIRTAAELAERFRSLKGEPATAIILKGWDLLAGSPAEAKAARDLASAEKDGKVRAGLAICIGADGTEENRSALRSLLSDPAPEVRGGAALGLGRSLSIEKERPNLVPSGPPLLALVGVGVLVDDPARGDLAVRLSGETDPGVRAILVGVLGPSAPGDPGIRKLLLEGLGGTFGDELREPCLKHLAAIKDAALVGELAEALPSAPKSLHGPILAAMAAADEKAAAEKLGDLLARAESPDLRREILAALGKVGGPAAQKAFTDALSGDADSAVRLLAATSLQRFPSREVLDAVQRAAENDADQAVRAEAERVAKIMKGTVEKPEGGAQENGDTPPAGGGN